MRIVLVYDVVNDARRRRLYKRLQGFLVPVQLSVFEGDATPKILEAIDRLIHRELDLEVDDVRIYRLCDGCVARVRHHGVAIPVADPDIPVVV